MTVEPGRIASLRQQVEAVNAERIRQEQVKRTAIERRDELLAEAEREFGVGSIEELEALLEREQAALEGDVADVEQAVQEARAKVAALPQ